MADTIGAYRFAAMQQLSDAGLLLPRRSVDALHEEIFAEGERELDFLKTKMPSADAFERCRIFVEQKNREMTRQTLHRLLGFGYWLTHLFAAFRLRKSVHDKELTQLGGWSNLIISLYDFFIDSKLMRPLTQKVILQRLMNADNVQRPLHSYVLPGYTPCYWLMLDLIGLFGQTARNTMSKESFIDLLKHIDKAAQVQNAFHTDKKFDPTTWKEKSTGPFLILAALAVADDRTENQSGHEAYQWAADFGSLIGLIDDLTDFEIDGKSGDFNKVREQYINSNSMKLFEQDFSACLQRAFPEHRSVADPRWLPALACLNSWISVWDERPADTPGYFQNSM